MVKRTTPKKHKRKSNTSAGTPQEGDRMKLRRMKPGAKLTENKPRALDLEQDGDRGNNSTRSDDGNQYQAFSDDESEEDLNTMDTSDNQEVVDMATPPSPSRTDTDGTALYLNSLVPLSLPPDSLLTVNDESFEQDSLNQYQVVPPNHKKKQ
jgi:hypothetical protein